MNKVMFRAGQSAWQGMLSATLLLAYAGTTQALPLDLGVPDTEVRFDNDVRYNTGIRVQSRNDRVSHNVGFDESDYSFGPGDLVTNRFDLLSQLDVVYKHDTGVRLSGSAWYDFAYAGKDVETAPGNEPVTGLPYSSLGAYPNNKFTSPTSRYYKGPSGELLDAFAFTKLQLGPVPVNVKVGQFATYWGEALFSDGVAYAQSPTDGRKALSVPGTQAKELFLPVSQVTAQAQIADDLSLGLQYMLDWKPGRAPEGGTYLGVGDFLFQGPTRLTIPLATGFAAFVPRADSVDADNHGSYGVNLRWSPAWLGGTMGVYYRQFDDVNPWVLGGAPDPTTMLPSNYHLTYAENERLYGFSVARNLSGVSVAFETTYRRNAALNTVGLAPLAEGARGDLYNALINAIAYSSSNAIWDSAVTSVELAATHYAKIRSNESVFNAEGEACTGGENVGCSTKNAAAFFLSFSPTWYQPIAGADISLPVVFTVGLAGNSADVATSMHKGSGTYSFGVAADVLYKYNVNIAYNGYFSHVNDDGTTNGAPLVDRGWLSLTLKASF
ncbi:DUF1302 family protein [Hydrocarboniphaga sp.]|uniref:DUF1302 domain-containing protein n=1 Tax=Hydrocarboniphaga sp. TaxID=2033016 RepID=UPI0026373830|nr:DUF1302 family protein [Hydrocarboniphaga sp.]